MTCRVYRLLKLSLSGTSDGSTLDITGEDISTLAFQQGGEGNDASELLPQTSRQETLTESKALQSC